MMLRLGSSNQLERELEAARARVRELDARVAASIGRERLAQQRVALADRLVDVALHAAGAMTAAESRLTHALVHLDRLTSDLSEHDDDFPPGRLEELVEPLGEVRSSLLDMRASLTDVLASPVRPVGSALDLRPIVRTSVRLTRSRVAHPARVELELDEVPPVLGGEERLVQLLCLLLTNAAEAVTRRGGGEALIGVRARTDGPDFVAIEITDSGDGIVPSQISRIFDPYVSTKNSPGAGLGLAIARQLVAPLGGEIDVQSERGQGATFTVRLPVAEQEAAPTEREPRQSIPLPGFVPARPPVRRLNLRRSM